MMRKILPKLPASVHKVNYNSLKDMKMTKYGLLDSLSNGQLTSKPNQGLNNLTQQNIPQMGGAEIF